MPGGAISDGVRERRFPRSRRLLVPKEFASVLGSGTRQHTAYFTFVVTPGTSAAGRLGITVSRKVSLNAVTRNAIKRQIRESFRHQHGMLAHMDIVVIAKRAAASVPPEQLRRQLDATWATLTARCKKS